ncbi:hypothetical protein LSCM1_05286 [Leishmania martiniquensis]|uniref:PH domain-containing protein n=1 Tax=Leishmania martiniquensis TaxID=1580590 RepID=A0A836HHR1_9TRYP|nr:hypothetical protein LSCM1_05286 [Leishmania martiniquensis]
MRYPTNATKPPAATQALPAPKPPLCEGWLEKFALCRGMFSRKGWHQRYAFVTHEGLGLSHANPRDKGNCLPGQPLRMTHARTFIPFAKRRNGEVELQPVYVVDDVSAARHPEVPKKSYNGICSESMSLTEGGSNGASTRDLAKTASINSGNSCTYYYFGLTFEEHRKRYLLLLRTSSPQEYIKWTTFLPLYVHEGSASRIVPLAHPLEVGRPQPIDLNHRRLTEKRESTLPSAVTFYLDPDPCAFSEYVRVRRACLDWDEGERQRLFTTAVERVRSLCGKSETAASESIAGLQDQSEEEYRNAVSSLFEELSPAVPERESRFTRSSRNDGPESCSTAISSLERTTCSSCAAKRTSTHLDPNDVTTSDPKTVKSSKPPISRRLLPNVIRKGSNPAGVRKIQKQPRLEKGAATGLAGPLRRRRTAV